MRGKVVKSDLLFLFKFLIGLRISKIFCIYPLDVILYSWTTYS